LALSAFLIGLSKGGLGGLLGAFSTPLLALVLPVNQALGLVVPLFILSDLLGLWAYWGQWDGRRIWRTLPGALLGVTLGTYFISRVQPQVLQIILGVIVLVFSAYKLFEKRLLSLARYQERPWHGPLAGALAGLTSSMANMGWPPLTIYLLLQKEMDAVLFNACSILFFAIVNWIKLPYYWSIGLIHLSTLMTALWLAPLLPLGVWLGVRLARCIPAQAFERVILALMVLSALFLMFT
jgi:uncharacterized membrane protein YfcA